MLKRVFISLLLVGTLINATVPTKSTLTKLYIATFNRAPDKAGLEYWLESGLALEEIAQSFFDQDETKEKYPDGFSNADFIISIYVNLFSRSADSEGFEYWHKELELGKIEQSMFILAVINGARDDDKKLLDNKTKVGLAFVEKGGANIKDATKILEDVTYDEKSVNIILCKNTLAGCSSDKVKTEDSNNTSKDDSSKKDEEKKTKVILEAKNDNAVGKTGKPTTVSVLTNDTIKYDKSPIVKIMIKTSTSTTYKTSYNGDNGKYEVKNKNQILFTPKSNFAGGDISISYALFDVNNKKFSDADVKIVYPKIFTLNRDDISGDGDKAITIAVLENDIIQDRANIKVKILREDPYSLEYLDSLDYYDGKFEVNSKNEIIFTPADDPIKGTVYMQYMAFDNNYNISASYITIEYPREFHTESDSVKANFGEVKSVNVLANDILPDDIDLTLSLDSSAPNEGTWSLDGDNSIKFTPNSNFGGGDVSTYYDLRDSNDELYSDDSVTISYPKRFYAEKDEIELPTLQSEYIIDVLQNDTLTSSPITIELVYYDENDQLVYTSSPVENDEGIWSIENNKIKFTPSDSVDINFVFIGYRISDGTYSSSSYINLTFPIKAEYYSRFIAYDKKPIELSILDKIEYSGSKTITATFNDKSKSITQDGIGKWSIIEGGDDGLIVKFSPDSSFKGNNSLVHLNLTDGTYNFSTNISIFYPNN